MILAIKLPNDISDRVLTFPFLHALYRYLEESLDEDESLIIHLISLQKGIDVLNLLPFKAFYHELEDEDIKTIFSIHRACMNFKIEGLDVFISTTESFVDASIGKNFSAKTRAGFAIGKNSWFLNKKISLNEEKHFSQQVFDLIKVVTDDVVPIKNVYSRNLSPFFSDYGEKPYLVINLDVVEGQFNSEWKEFIELFENKKIILLTQDFEVDLQKSELESFVGELSPKNEYEVFILDSHIDFAKLVTYAACFITHDSYLSYISAYCGAYTFLLNRRTHNKSKAPAHFLGETKYFDLRERSQYAKAFDTMYTYIEDKTKVEADD